MKNELGIEKKCENCWHCSLYTWRATGNTCELCEEDGKHVLNTKRCHFWITDDAYKARIKELQEQQSCKQSCKEENATCKKSLQVSRSDIEQMVKPLQWEELEKRTTYEDGFTEVYRSAESNLFFGMLKFRIFKFYNEFKELRLLDCFKGQSISIKSGNYSLDEIKQYAQKWLVNLVSSALGVEE